MRILHVLDHSLPLHSGYAFRTAAILRESQALGWETVQLTTPRQGAAGGAAQEEADGLVFHRTTLRPGPLSWLPGGVYLDEMRATERRILQLVEEHAPDVIHAHSPVLNALPALRAGERTGIPVVYEVRALWEDAAVEHGTTSDGSMRYRASRALESHALHRAAHITTICEGLRLEIAGRGVALERITVVPNAVDPNAFRAGIPRDRYLARTLGLDSATVVGFAGSFYGYEGLDLLLEATALLAPRRPDLRVLLVGGGPQAAALGALASSLGIAHRVVFPGRVRHAEVGRYYDLIDVLVYPRHRNRLTELVTPLKPLEAMAQGRTFIASDVGGHRELVRDGETGFLFPAEDVQALAAMIERVLDAHEECGRVAQQARHFVETERTWARSVACYRGVYEALTTPAGALASA